MRNLVVCGALAIGAVAASADLVQPLSQNRYVRAQASSMGGGSEMEEFFAADYLPFNAEATAFSAIARQDSVIGGSTLSGELFGQGQADIFSGSSGRSHYEVAFALTQDCSYSSVITSDVSRWSISSYTLRNGANEIVFQLYRNQEFSVRTDTFSGNVPAGNYTFEAWVYGYSSQGLLGRAGGDFELNFVPAPATAVVIGFGALIAGKRRRPSQR